MKIIVIVTTLVVLVVTPTFASFFDEFRGVISLPHSSFGRLFTNVVSDVSETIGCTILAVKQVLALDGSYHEPLDYNIRCKGQIGATTGNAKERSLDNLDENSAQGEIENIEAQLKTQTDRLWEISNLLRRELDNIPSDIKIQFGVREPNPSESVVGRIWSDLKILHDIEHNNEENNPQVAEIHQVLDKALGIMRMNETNSNKSDDDKIKSIVRGIEKESNDTLIEVEKEFTQWEEQESKIKHESNGTVINVEDDSSRLENGVEEIIKDLEEDSIDSSNVKTFMVTEDNNNESDTKEMDSFNNSMPESDLIAKDDSKETIIHETEEDSVNSSSVESVFMSEDDTEYVDKDTKENNDINSNQLNKSEQAEMTVASTTITIDTTSNIFTPTTTTVAPTTSVTPTIAVTPATSVTSTTTVAPTTSVTPAITVAPASSVTTTTTVVPTTSVTSTTTVTPVTCVTPTTTVAPTTSVRSTTTVAISTSTTTCATTTTTVTPTASVPSIKTTTAVPSTIITPLTTEDPEFLEFQSIILSQMAPQDVKHQEQVASEAQKLIRDSKYRNTIFYYLKSSDDSSTPNVFDNPELFNFN